MNSVEAIVDPLSKHWLGEGVVDPGYREIFRQLSVEIECIVGTAGVQLSDASPEQRRNALSALLPEMKNSVVVKELAHEITKPPQAVELNHDVPTRILFITAEPDGLERLRLDEEQRKMVLTLRLATERDHFRIEAFPAARLEDIEDRLLEFRPHIFHFSGHGVDGKIILPAEGGKHREVDCANLAKLLGCVSSVHIAILSACYTAKQAEAVIRRIPAVISMGTAIEDDAAIDFSDCFYRALFRRCSLLKSFEFARAGLEARNWPEDQLPSLLTGEKVDPAKMHFGEASC